MSNQTSTKFLDEMVEDIRSEREHPFASGVQGLVGDFDITHTVLVNPADNALVARQNPRRVYLGFFSTTGSTAAVAPNSFPIGGNTGFRFPAANSNLEFFWTKHAVLVTMPWQCFGLGLGTLSVYEVIWSPRR